MVQKSELSVEKITQALELSSGKAAEAARMLGCKYPTLMNWIYKYNIPHGSRRHYNISTDELWEAYKELQSLKLVAEKFNLSNKEVVRCRLKKAGHKLNVLTRYPCNDDFFKKDSEESFYWAGFIAADGCVKEKRRNLYSNSICYQLQIGLSQKDKSHIQKFKDAIEYEGPVKDFLVKNSKRNPNWNDTWKSEITVTSKSIFDDLARFNIVPRKSLTLTFPEWMKDHPLKHHFMRGYLDGDGSFYVPKQKKPTKQEYCSIRGTPDFLKDYRSILESECGLEIRTKPIRISSKHGMLEYGGNGILPKIREFLSKDATIYLDRKWTNSQS